MDEKTAALIARIKERIADDRLDDPDAPEFPPVSAAEIRRAEGRLGFRLPELLKTLYTEVANGGFGPYEGILGLENGWATKNGEGKTLVEVYEDAHNEIPDLPNWRWPGELLPVCEDGAALICLDCSREESPVISFEYSLGSGGVPEVGWQINLRRESSTFQRWLEMWAFKPHPNRK